MIGVQLDYFPIQTSGRFQIISNARIARLLVLFTIGRIVVRFCDLVGLWAFGGNVASIRVVTHDQIG